MTDIVESLKTSHKRVARVCFLLSTMIVVRRLSRSNIRDCINLLEGTAKNLRQLIGELEKDD